MKVRLRYKLEVRDRDGRLLVRHRGEARSWVIAFIDMFHGFTDFINKSITDTGNTVRTIAITSQVQQFRLDAAAAAATHGPVVGTGTTAVAIGDVALATQIAEGSGAGQLNHAVVTIGSPSTSGSTRSFTVQRVFTNNSGASITIKEVGLYSVAQDTGGVLRYVCLVRDVVTATAVPNLGSATLTYTVSISV